MRTPSLLALLSLSVAVPTAAAQLPLLPAGSQIRVTHTVRSCASRLCPRHKERLVGSLVTTRADSMFLDTDEGSVAALPTSAITRIERPGSKPWAPVAYAGLGALSGAALGAAVWFPQAFATETLDAAACDPNGSISCVQRDPFVSHLAKGAAVGAAVGFVMGLIEEAAARSRWVNVFTAGATSAVALTPTAAPRSVGLMGRVRF